MTGQVQTGRAMLEALLPLKCSLILAFAPALRYFPHWLSNSICDLSPESFKSLQAKIQQL